MKSIVLYYSMTGNTKSVAKAIQKGIGQGCEFARLNEIDAINLLDYDLIGFGAPVIGYREPPVVTEFMKSLPKLDGKYAFTFCTHGTCPSGFVAEMVSSMREKGLTVTGWNDWFGGAFMPYIDRPYYTDGHPDEIDLKEAQEFGEEVIERTSQISKGEIDLIPQLPSKDQYDKLYGTPPLREELPDDLNIPPSEWEKLKPEVIPEKCTACGLCVDNCPNSAITMDDQVSISHEACGPCHVWFCEQLCPTGAIQVNWGPMEIREESTRIYFVKLAESMVKYKDLRRFRILFPPEEEGTKEALSKRMQHPKIKIQDGIVSICERMNH